MNEINELIELVTRRLATVATSDVVSGDPIVAGKVTIVPLSRISMGFGGGGGEGEGEPDKEKPGHKKHTRGKGVGGGVGGGASLRPVGIAVFSDKGVQVIPVPSKKGTIDKIFDKLPELFEKIKDMVPAK